jgi:hypothetical protein
MALCQKGVELHSCEQLCQESLGNAMLMTVLPPLLVVTTGDC